MTKINTILLSLFLVFNLSAQEVVMEENYEPIEKEDIKGPNSKFFTQSYISVGFFVDQPLNGSRETIYGTSNQYQVGTRSKLKLNNILALTGDLGISRTKMSTDHNFIVPDIYDLVIPDNEFLRLYQVMGAPAIRINFDPKRGNFMGVFLDLGVYVAYSFSEVRVYKYTRDLNNYSYKKEIVRRSNLKDIENFNYGFKARLGYNKYALVGQLRYSELNLSQYPAITIGFEYGPFDN